MRRLSIAVSVALLAVLGLALAVAGQDGGVLVTLPTIRLSQAVPTVVDVEIPQADGSVVTASVPVSVDVEVTLDLLTMDPEVTPVAESPMFDLEDLAEMHLTLDQIPAGFVDDSENSTDYSPDEYADNFLDPESMLAFLANVGYLGGALSSFENVQFNMFGRSNAYIASQTHLFETAEGADHFLENLESVFMEDYDWDATSIQMVSAPKLGDSSVAYLIGLEGDGETVDAVAMTALAVRKGNALLLAMGASLPGAGNFDQVIDMMEMHLNKVEALE